MWWRLLLSSKLRTGRSRNLSLRLKPQHVCNQRKGGLNGKTQHSKGATWHTASHIHPQKCKHLRITWSNYEPLHSWTTFLHWGMGCLQLLQKAHSKQTQSWDQYPYYCKKRECICISRLLRQLLSIFNSLGLCDFTVWTSKSPESPFSRHRKMFFSHLQGVHKLPCRIYHEMQSHASKTLKATANNMGSKWQVTFTSVIALCHKPYTNSFYPPKKIPLRGKIPFCPSLGFALK